MNISIGKQHTPAMLLIVELRRNEEDNKYDLTEVLDQFPLEDLTAVLNEEE